MLYMLTLLFKMAIMGCEGEPKGRCKYPPLQCVWGEYCWTHLRVHQHWHRISTVSCAFTPVTSQNTIQSIYSQWICQIKSLERENRAKGMNGCGL